MNCEHDANKLTFYFGHKRLATAYSVYALSQRDADGVLGFLGIKIPFRLWFLMHSDMVSFETNHD